MITECMLSHLYTYSESGQYPPGSLHKCSCKHDKMKTTNVCRSILWNVSYMLNQDNQYNQSRKSSQIMYRFIVAMLCDLSTQNFVAVFACGKLYIVYGVYCTNEQYHTCTGITEKLIMNTINNVVACSTMEEGGVLKLISITLAECLKVVFSLSYTGSTIHAAE